MLISRNLQMKILLINTMYFKHPKILAMDDRESIKKHYNKIPNKSIQERKHTRNINIRNANNFVKSCLMKKCIYNVDNVLDFGIGKGGDLKKYDSIGVKEVYGVDIANRSILDALRRARDAKLSFKLVLKVKDCFTSPFDLKKKFNVISIQFSFHYCFCKEEYVDITLDNISRHLKNDGRVLITIPSKEEILRRKELGRLSNKFYSINFKNKDSQEIYGNAYFYSLIDSLDECVEYLVDVDVLREKAIKKGLELDFRVNFREFFEENATLYPQIYENIVTKELNREENEVVDLHEILVFKKITNND